MNRFQLVITMADGVIIITGIGDVGAHIDAAYDTYGVCGVTVRHP